jgi:hypothetical protein
MTRLEQFHQRKRDDKTDSGPFQASQNGVKHTWPDCSAGECLAQAHAPRQLLDSSHRYSMALLGAKLSRLLVSAEKMGSSLEMR